ncbi:MAG: DNA-processing protein DprA [Tissierellia bacterium]|nr:DNA-processing protein DprA [Tissierellia bacterium]
MERRELYIAASELGFTSEEILKLSKIFHLFQDSKELFQIQGESLLSGRKSKDRLYGNWEEALEKVYHITEKLNIGILTYEDSEFPEELKDIENPPAIIYYRGDFLKTLSYKRMGIVGSRKHTHYGENICRGISKDLSDLKIVSVSGMALGLDGIAHKEAINHDFLTIAVLGCGVDVIYPKSHSKLYLDIIKQGAVISEYPLGTKPMNYFFPERNRIIAGLSQGLVVIEARERSGSLITARLAAEQGKEVFAVPGNINSLYSKGTNALIRDGAHPYLSREDIITFLDIKDVVKTEKIRDLSHEEEKIYSYIQNGINTANLLCIETGESITFINSILTILEMKGFIQLEGADRFTITSML